MASPGPWAQSPLPGISFCRPAGQTTHNSKVIYINCCIHSWCWVLCLQYVNGMLFWIRNYSCLGWLGCSLQTTSATFHCPNLDTSIRCAVYIHAVIGWMYWLWHDQGIWYDIIWHIALSQHSAGSKTTHRQLQSHLNIAYSMTMLLVLLASTSCGWSFMKTTLGCTWGNDYR